jgi:cytoskeletal protein RodZ
MHITGMKSLLSQSSASRRRKIIVASIILVCLLGGGAGAAVYFTSQQREAANNTQRDASTVKKEQADADSKDNPESQLPSKNSKDSTQNQDGQSDQTPSTPPEKPTIERAGGDPIKVVATFQQASSGSCKLQLSQAGQQTLSYTAGIVVSTSYYTCSFNVPRNALPSGGQWNATIIHHVGNASTPSDPARLQ